MKIIILLQFILSTLITPNMVMANELTQEQFQKFTQTVDGWRTNQAGGTISPDAWRTGIKHFFDNNCSGGSCKSCLLGIADVKGERNADLWIGTFNGSAPFSIITTEAGSHVSKSRNHNYILTDACNKGATRFIKCDSTQCCFGASAAASKNNKCYDIARLRRYEQLLNEDGSVTKVGETLLRYGIPYHDSQDGQLMFHDADYCTGTKCAGRSAGCITQSPMQQKRFCNEVYDQNRNLVWTVFNPNAGGSSIGNEALRDAAKKWYAMGESIRCQKTANMVSITDPSAPSPHPVGAYAGNDVTPTSNDVGANTPTPSGSEPFNECQQVASNSHIQRSEAVANGQNTDASFKGEVDKTNDNSNPLGTGGKMAEAAATQATITNCHATNTSEVRSSGGMVAVLGIVAAGGLVAWLAMGSKDDDKAEGATTPEDQAQAQQYAEISSSVPDDYMISPDAAITATAGEGQTVDSQDAINAGTLYQQSLEYEYQEAKKEREKTILNLGNSAQTYTESEDKQAEANSYQNYSQDLAVGSIESYENVYENRLEAMTRRLETFPDPGKVISLCSQRMNSAGVLNDNAYRSMTNHYQQVTDVPELDLGSADEICQNYVQRDMNHLFKNQHIQGQLQGIIQDSANVLKGLGELKAAVQDQKLTPAQRAKLMKNHPVLSELQSRYQMLDSCERIGCWNSPKSNFRKVGSYTDGATDPVVKGMTEELEAALRSRTTVNFNANFKNSPKYSSLLQGGYNSSNSFQQNISNAKSALKDSLQNSRFNHKGAGLVDGQEASANSVAALGQLDVQYQQGRSNVQYVRDEQGLLKNPKTNKPAPGFEAPAHENLFKIISKRYQVKFFAQ